MDQSLTILSVRIPFLSLKRRLRFSIWSALVLALVLTGEGGWAQGDGSVAPALDGDPTQQGNRLRGEITPGIKLGAVDAKSVQESDYLNHLNQLRITPRSMPMKAATGAEAIRSRPVLNNPIEKVKGPGESNTSDDEFVDIARPPLKSLIMFNDYINPFRLDAIETRTLSLKDALVTGILQNLDLAISRTSTKQKQFAYYSALGNFAPDPNMGFSEFFTKGAIGLPNNSFTRAFSGAGAGGISGTGGSNAIIKLDRPFEIMHAGVQYYAYRGGSVLFGALQARNNYRAAKHQEMASLSDTLMNVTQNYYNLVLAEALLQIRIEAVRTSEEQLKRNQDRFHSGLATNLDVLQSKTQLSRDRQALVDQQSDRRTASITLADSIYLPLSEDVVPIDLSVRKTRLIDSRLNIGQLLGIAIDSRPELKQYEELRRAAKKAIMVSAADLQPTVSLGGNAYGIGPPSNVQALGVFAVNLNWRLKGFGIVDSMDTVQAKWQARQAALEAQKELQTVCREVRNSFVRILDKERNIEEASNEVRSAFEELRLAELRKMSGLGLNLDILTAQRDVTQARISKARAIIDFNIAQAQLLRDLGLISSEALTSGKVLTTQ